MSDTAASVDGQAATQPAPDAPPAATTESKWYDSAPDEIKGYIQNKQWDDPIKAVESYRNLEKFHGVPPEQILKLPKDASDKSAWDGIYAKLGRPEKPDGYKVEFKDPDLKGVEIDKVRLGAYAQVAHAAGLSQQQFEQLAEADAKFFKQFEAQHLEAKKLQNEADYQALRKEWGAHAEEREELSRRGLKALLPDGMDKEAVAQAIEDAIGTAAALKLFANAGERLAREDRVPDSSGDRPFGYTKEQALADKAALMDELKADRTKLDNYNRGIGPEYTKMQKLLKIISA